MDRPRLLGLAGVVLILHNRPMTGDAGWGWLASGVSLVSITIGTLYQRRFCSRIDWRAGNVVQYIGVTVLFGAGALAFESNEVQWSAEFALALAWLAVVLSIGTIGLLYWLIRHSAATSVASLFYLVPAVTAADGLCAVRRAARCGRDRRDDGVRGRGVSGQRPNLGAHRARIQRIKKPPDLDPEAWVCGLVSREGSAVQRFAFLALLFFLGAFFATFLVAFLVAFLPAFLAAFLPAFFAAFFALLGLLCSLCRRDFLGDFLGRLSLSLLGAGFGCGLGAPSRSHRHLFRLRVYRRPYRPPTLKQSTTIARFPRLSKLGDPIQAARSFA